MNQNIELEAKILIIEPFYGGSHKVLINTLINHFPNSKLVSLPAKKWHWRARCGVAMILDKIPAITTEKILFCSSVLSLPELLGVRSDLVKLRKIVYFHENQLVYPTREVKERDIQYSYNQIMTALAADLVLFNSNFNKSSFLDNIPRILNMFPDFKPKNFRSLIEKKSQTLYFPVEYPKILSSKENYDILEILWPHRWEFDKDPETFFGVLLKLKENGLQFKVNILGEDFTDNPEIFERARHNLNAEISHYGYCKSKDKYYEILARSHVVVSTSKHEFFGVALLEATYCGCLPLAPNRLVYPEIYPKNCLYGTTDDLYEKLQKFCEAPNLVKEKRDELKIDFERFSSDRILRKFEGIFEHTTET